ncbi:MAG: hypothetical protein UV05_C0023G0003 [candidate division CPR1 bacterium GW2011_GWA2_42_17]|uniref:DUF4012 domain-containing protein n=1 Tax=candidate division CPR1 bacterium GW2011_GWA2_42_17 TaxID=1618341 RepID=A0A0G0Z4S3_9BACT|nr:MAG: hypothetical protein UV05_C0023G0003 [candidate division CPR1 bacterium GW2011_GWA2_42_17]
MNKDNKKHTKLLRVLLSLIIVLSAFGILGYFFAVKPGLVLVADAKEGVTLGKRVKQDLKTQDLTLWQKDLNETAVFLDRFKKHYRSFDYLSWVPFVSSYHQDSWEALKAADHGIKAGKIVLESLQPFAAALGLGTEGAGVSVDQKIAELVTVSPKIVPGITQALAELDALRQEFGKIDPNNYPVKLGNLVIRENIKNVANQLDNFKYVLANAKPLLNSLPQALGSPIPQTYLILFQNDKELRPTGGFISAYALVKLSNGKIQIIKSDDIYPLDQDRKILPAPKPIIDYLKVDGFYMRDTNFSPDFKKSMSDFEVYYAQSGSPAISGIIALDTHFVERMMELSGPLVVPGYTFDFAGSGYSSCRQGGIAFTAENVVCRLEVYAEKLMIGGGRDRKAMLGDLMEKLLDWLMHAPQDRWGQITNQVLGEAQGKHLLLYFHDKTLQELAENYNFAGKVKEFGGDYLGIYDANLAAAKSDLYMTRRVEKSILTKKDGSIQVKLTLTYANTGYADGWLNTTYRDYQRVYIPQGSTLINYSGGDLKPQVYDDLGKTVIANFIRVAPKSSTTVVYEYQLPFKTPKDRIFKMLIQKQGGIDMASYTVNFNGQVKSFQLTKDEEIEFRF